MKRRSMVLSAQAPRVGGASPFLPAAAARIPAHRLTAKDVAWAIEVAASCVENRAVERVVRAASPADAEKAAREMLRYWGSHGFAGEVSALSLGNDPATQHNAGLHIRAGSRRGFLPWRIVAQLIRQEVAPSDVIRSTAATRVKPGAAITPRPIQHRRQTAMATKTKLTEDKIKAKVEKLRSEGKSFTEIRDELGGKEGDGLYNLVGRIGKAWDAGHPAQAAKLHVGRTMKAVASPKKAATAPKPNGSGPKRKNTTKDRVREKRQADAKALQATLQKQRAVATPAVATPTPATGRKRRAA